ncbi:hypothetical protein PNEG_02327 [Pneumocystis murina B123]|uniref:Mannosyltransferase n=1 Tax=Pneumocystis murina (strain B123) TaxID=1069680 RepID=M7P696_PNEMU|nr:hypothetical protein PNEG_02327 [Pneumocystis murina B123]EMR09380.1 hypothetical protein PNEG_02327 [Pneumocystis murina B123]
MKFLIFCGIYICLVLIRLGFSISESYIHPDEHLQGIQVVAGNILNIKVEYPWEFKGQFPIRSIGPLLIIYGLPLKISQWISGDTPVNPLFIFFLLRVFFFGLSFFIGRKFFKWRELFYNDEDWFIYTSTPLKYRRKALLIYASSFVTWTYQTHTFSNSIETIMVSICLFLIQKIKMNIRPWKCVLLAIFSSFGFFSRITFPIVLLPFVASFSKSLIKRPKIIFSIIKSFMLMFFIFILIDSFYYANGYRVIITPLNNFKYNSKYINLQKHGIHSYWTHFLINVPILLGPAIILPIIVKNIKFNLYLISSVLYILILSLFPHQELRFLLPVFPLLIIYLSSLGNIRKKKIRYLFIFSWIIYNIFFGIFLGFFHQHDVISIIFFLKKYLVNDSSANVVFWKTYPPPTWLFLDPPDSKIIFSHLIGYSVNNVLDYLSIKKQNGVKSIFIFPTLLIEKLPCVFEELRNSSCKTNVTLRQIFKTSYYIGLDDSDFINNNIFFVLMDLIRKKGLVVCEVI